AGVSAGESADLVHVYGEGAVGFRQSSIISHRYAYGTASILRKPRDAVFQDDPTNLTGSPCADTTQRYPGRFSAPRRGLGPVLARFLLVTAQVRASHPRGRRSGPGLPDRLRTSFPGQPPPFYQRKIKSDAIPRNLPA